MSDVSGLHITGVGQKPVVQRITCVKNKNREPCCLAHPPFSPSEILPAILVPVTILPSKVLSRQDNRPGESHERAYNNVGEFSPQERAFHVLLMACPDEMYNRDEMFAVGIVTRPESWD